MKKEQKSFQYKRDLLDILYKISKNKKFYFLIQTIYSPFFKQDLEPFLGLRFYPFKNKNQTLNDIENLNFFDLNNQDFFIKDKNNANDALLVSGLWINLICVRLSHYRYKFWRIFAYEETTDETTLASKEEFYKFIHQFYPFMLNLLRLKDVYVIDDSLISDTNVDFNHRELFRNESLLKLWSQFSYDKLASFSDVILKDYDTLKDLDLNKDEPLLKKYLKKYSKSTQKPDFLYEDINNILYRGQDLYDLRYVFLDALVKHDFNMIDAYNDLINTKYNLFKWHIIKYITTILIHYLDTWFAKMIEILINTKRFIFFNQHLVNKSFNNFIQAGLTAIENDNWKDFSGLIKYLDFDNLAFSRLHKNNKYNELPAYWFLTKNKFKMLKTQLQTASFLNVNRINDTINDDLNNSSNDYLDPSLFFSKIDGDFVIDDPPIRTLLDKSVGLNGLFDFVRDEISFSKEYVDKLVQDQEKFIKKSAYDVFVSKIENDPNFNNDNVVFMIDPNFKKTKGLFINNDYVPLLYSSSKYTSKKEIIEDYLRFPNVIICSNKNKEQVKKVWIECCDYYKNSLDKIFLGMGFDENEIKNVVDEAFSLKKSIIEHNEKVIDSKFTYKPNNSYEKEENDREDQQTNTKIRR